MRCTLSEIRGKEIISIKNGAKLGYADDVELETDNLSVKSLIIYGRTKLFGLLGREDSIVVDAQDICIIGVDTVLVRSEKYISTKINEKYQESLFK